MNDIDNLLKNIELEIKESIRAYDSLVEVYCNYYNKNDTIIYDEYVDQAWLIPFETTIKKLDDKTAIFITDNVLFKFDIITSDYNYFSGMRCLLEDFNEADIFKDYLDAFYKYANKHKVKNSRIVKFLTAWNYNKYDKEEYDLAGYIDYNKLNDILYTCLTKE